MAYSVAANTRLAGAANGNFLDDLTNPGVGQWPKTQAIQAITQIVVFGGSIIDSLRITYQVQNATAPITVQHGGPGGTEILNFKIGANEKLIAVYGNRRVSPGPFGDKNIVQLSFVVANSGANVPTVKVYASPGDFTQPTEKFEFSWALVAASSYTFQPTGAANSYLQAIGFSKVLDQTGGPLL